MYTHTLTYIYENGNHEIMETINRIKDSYIVIRHNPIKLLEVNNKCKTFSDINHSNIFFGQSPKANEIKMKISKWDLIKFESFCTAKETINQTKRSSTECDRIFAKDVTNS